GYERDELLPLGAGAIIHPDDGPLVERLEQALDESESGTLEAERRYVRKDGSVMWAHIAVATIRDYDGLPRHRVLNVIDITRRRAAEQLFSASFERSAVPMIILDDNRVLTDVNEAATELFGIPACESLGLALDVFLPDQPVERRW